MLRSHLAGARLSDGQSEEELFEMIVGLQTGAAFVFCPSAMLDVYDNDIQLLKDGFIKARIRSRITADGGKSILASDQAHQLEIEEADIPIEDVIRPFTDPINSGKKRAPDDDQAPTQDYGGIRKLRRTADNVASRVDARGNSRDEAILVDDSGTSTHTRPSTSSRTPATSTAQTATASRPRTDIGQDEARSYVRDEVKKALRKDPGFTDFQKVRYEAAYFAGLPKRFFETPKGWNIWSRQVIHEAVVSSFCTDKTLIVD